MKAFKIKSLLRSAAVLGVGLFCHSAIAADKPNVVVIYTDDLGYGDYNYAGATAVYTPNIDRIAKNGLNFTNGYATASVCTPSRYSILTGSYPYRKPDANILPGNAKSLIEPGTTTIASVMKSAGYATGCVGKWHLGLGDGKIDWNADVKPGPLEIGFDESFIIPATPDRTPCVYVEGHRVVGLDPADPIEVAYGKKIGTLPTGKDHPELLRYGLTAGHANTIVNRISRIGFQSGGTSALWNDDTMSATLADRADRFIRDHKDKPFFLYFATNGIHVPRSPNIKFLGTSKSGLRGDTINELDWQVGQVLQTLDELKLTDNTLIIFSSDNGPVLDDGYDDGSLQANGDQTPAGPLRGWKTSIYEGGTRLPFITLWPGHIKPGTSSALVSQVDLCASLAELVGTPLSSDACPDSMNVLPALLGQTSQGRDHYIEQSMVHVLAIRQGQWKYIEPQKAAKKRASDEDPAVTTGQLFDLSNDIGEKTNVIADHPDIAKKLADLLAHDRQSAATR